MREKRDEGTSVSRRGATATAGWSSFDGIGIRHKGHHAAPMPIESGQIDAERWKVAQSHRATGPQGHRTTGIRGGHSSFQFTLPLGGSSEARGGPSTEIAN